MAVPLRETRFCRLGSQSGYGVPFDAGQGRPKNERCTAVSGNRSTRSSVKLRRRRDGMNWRGRVSGTMLAALGACQVGMAQADLGTRYRAGYEEVRITDPSRNRLIQLDVWFPAAMEEPRTATA
jgi:hypothetical protein